MNTFHCFKRFLIWITKVYKLQQTVCDARVIFSGNIGFPCLEKRGMDWVKDNMTSRLVSGLKGGWEIIKWSATAHCGVEGYVRHYWLKPYPCLFIAFICWNPENHGRRKAVIAKKTNVEEDMLCRPQLNWNKGKGTMKIALNS